jgi:DNA-binding transcriptional regulator YiaG
MSRGLANHGTSSGTVKILGGGAFAPTNPRNDRHVAVRSVACPTCGVGVGEPCVSSTGKRANHPTRRRMALRAEQAPSYSVDDVMFVRCFSPAGRKAIRSDRGITQGQLAEIIGTDREVLSRWERGDSVASGNAGARYGAWLRDQVASAA